ncbi:Uncharacterized protein Adt_41194 [Abeliophyllum distichum]|uniref:AGC-kinase C-terminal domain-containing protein n=1 Tax=Abeliophyllum distichum TaxID=126358 RepID=A0ABD1PN61_9LAMI
MLGIAKDTETLIKKLNLSKERGPRIADDIQDIQEQPFLFDNVVGAGDQENQENVKFTPKSFFNSGSELETFSDQEFLQFMTTRDTFNPNTFDVVPMYYFVVGCCCSKFVGLVSIY